MLTVTKIRSAKPREKPYKLFDSRGLYLIVNPNKSRWWRFRYSYGGREKLLSLGTYPDTSLKLAREKRDQARELVAQRIDPSANRQAERLAQAETFEALAREWLDLSRSPQSGVLKPGTLKQLERRLEKHVFPFLGNKPLSEISAADLLSVLRRIESKGAHETAHRVRALCSRILRYGIATGRAERDVAGDLQGALAPVKSTHFPAITEPRAIGELLRAIDGYLGQPSVTAALQLAPLVFVRPGELRAAKWKEINLEAAEWRIPPERMKMGSTHLVPLASQALSILSNLKPYTGSGELVFPSLRTPSRPISENTLNAALRRLGYSKEQMTTHGFRTMASTRLNELGFEPDIIELQLAHTDQNKVRAAYNRAERLNDRKKMMQAWADYLEGLENGAQVIAIRSVSK